MGTMRWVFHTRGQQPSYKSLRHTWVKSMAKQSDKRLRIDAEICFAPVAFDSSSFLNRRSVQRVRRGMKSFSSWSGMLKKGVSTTSGGRWLLETKVFAKISALAFASTSHVDPSRKGGIDFTFAVRRRSSRLMRHHCLLHLGEALNLAFNFSTYFARSSRKIVAHCS